MGCCSSKYQIPKPTFLNQSAPQTKKDASTQTQTTQTTQTQQAQQPEPLHISPSCQSIINIFREVEPYQPPPQTRPTSLLGYGADRLSPLPLAEQEGTDGMPSSGMQLLLKRKITECLGVCRSFLPTSGGGQKNGRGALKSLCLTGKHSKAKVVKTEKYLSEEMFVNL